MTTPLLDQDSFRGRNDDGSETGATWKAAVNVDWTQDVDEIFRVRFLIQETAGGPANNATGRPQYNLNGAGWNTITTTSSVVKSVGSANTSWTLTDEDETTQQIGSGTWEGGAFDDDGLAGELNQIDIGGNEETEIEWCLQIVGADVSDEDTIQIRVVTASLGLLDSYTNTPSITVNKAGGTLYYQSAAGTLTSAGVLAKRPARGLAGALTSAGVLARQMARGLAGTLMSAGALVGQGRKALGGTLTSAGGLARRTARGLAGTLTSAGALSAVKTFVRALAGTLTSAGSLARPLQ